MDENSRLSFISTNTGEVEFGRNLLGIVIIVGISHPLELEVKKKNVKNPNLPSSC